MARKTMFTLASALALMSLLLIVGVAGKDEVLSESEEPFHIILPVQHQKSEDPEVKRSDLVEPSNGPGMTYADDVSDMHDPGLAADFNPAALHRKIRSQPRDEAWASRSEDNLRSAVGDSLFNRPGIDIRTNCASSLCEARGLIKAPHASAEASSVIDLLQSGETVNRLALNGQGFVTIGIAKRPDGVAFFLYSRRID
ncbi:MAG: hypothetical protein H2055_10035 [Sphingopyxis sp.]|nr:hypothetical protein [Sphingopyxis sp.]